ncbi:MAG: hypothetical protein ACK4L7_10145 [Flavobacteriales bacterium]
MRAIRLLPAAIMPLLAAAIHAQSPLPTEVHVSSAAFIARDRPMGLADWRALLPASALLGGDVPRNDHQGHGGAPAGYPGPLPGWEIDSAPWGLGSACLGAGLNLWRGDGEGARYEKRLRIAFNGLGESRRYAD